MTASTLSPAHSPADRRTNRAGSGDAEPFELYYIANGTRHPVDVPEAGVTHRPGTHCDPGAGYDTGAVSK